MLRVRVLTAIAAGIALKAALMPFVSSEQLHQEVHGIGSYLEVLGALYSIIVAFTIYVVWEQYNRVQIGLAQEAAALEDLSRVAGFLSERSAVTQIRHAARQYVESTLNDEPPRLAVGERSALAEERLAALGQAVRGAPVKTEKEVVLFEELLRSLGRVNDARDERLSVSATRIPSTLWSLVVFASCALLGGFLLLGIRSFALSAAVVGAVAGSLAFLLSVVKDMDNPFTGVWNVSYQPMRAVAGRIGLQ